MAGIVRSECRTQVQGAKELGYQAVSHRFDMHFVFREEMISYGGIRSNAVALVDVTRNLPAQENLCRSRGEHNVFGDWRKRLARGAQTADDEELKRSKPPGKHADIVRRSAENNRRETDAPRERREG